MPDSLTGDPLEGMLAVSRKTRWAGRVGPQSPVASTVEMRK